MKWQKEMIISTVLIVFFTVTMVLTGCGGTQTFTVGGTVSGLNGTIILQNNGGDDLTITSDGSFTFATALADGSSYDVTIKTHPSGQCGFVANGNGTILGGDVTAVSVNCCNSGSLDTTFDLDGMVVYNEGNPDRGNSITIDGTGKILVTGYSGSGLNEDMLIWRYNADGSSDTTFDSDGIVVYNYTGGTNPNPDRGYSITTDANGKILVSGWNFFTDQTLNSLLTWRYNTDGSMDPTFEYSYPHPNFLVNAFTWYDRSITTDSSNKILVVGSTSFVPPNMLIVRYNTDGTQDNVVTYNGGNSDEGYSITTDADGKILVTGYSNNGSNDDMVIWRYTTGGSLDTTFDTDGMVVYDGGIEDDEEGYCITTDADGKILVTGYLYNDKTPDPSDTDMGIWRYNTDGSPDTTFDTDGVVSYDSGGYDDKGLSITIDTDGKILVTGYSNNGSNDDMVIWRYIQ
jgi:uncharacterized delta-60 repeat protein